MKKFGLLVFLSLIIASPAMASVAPVSTSQCWYFDEQTLPYGIVPPREDVDNPFGTPVALIQDMSGTSVRWVDGIWVGPEFKIILDIPNQPIENPYKTLTLTMRYRGDISFEWIADIVSGDHFELISENPVYEGGGWVTLTQEWYFEPNPVEEIVVIGLQGVDVQTAFIPAAIDWICINTTCVPEPMTIVLLALGAGFVVRRR